MRIWSIWDILYVCCVQSSPCICVRCARRHRRRWLSRVSVDRSVGVCMCKCWVSVPLFFVFNLPLARFTCLFVIKLTLNLISSALSNFCFPKTDAASMIWYFFFCFVSFFSVVWFNSILFLHFLQSFSFGYDLFSCDLLLSAQATFNIIPEHVWIVVHHSTE